MERDCIIYGHLVYLKANCYILWPFGLHILKLIDIFNGHLVYFKAIWYILKLFGIF
jgi:hypothetical protein